MKTLRIILLAAVLVPGLGAQTDWSAYGHDPGGQRYSPLTQITTQNVSKLKLAWQFGIDPAAADINPATQVLPATEAVPIVVGGVLYTPIAPSSILALESNTGREVWRHELGRARAPTRGVTYWSGDGRPRRAFLRGRATEAAGASMPRRGSWFRDSARRAPSICASASPRSFPTRLIV